MACRSEVRTHLDLFSGIGGFALAARWAGLETLQFVEIDSFAQKVLKKNFPGVPIHDDIKTFDATQLCQPFLLTGGYPCQPFSQAGKRRGKEDDRHLWPEMLRVIRECRPTWILAENVAGHITMGLDTVLADLESEDYACRTFVIPACAKDAPHRRDRVWIVAHSKENDSNSNRQRSHREEEQQCRVRSSEPADRESSESGQIREVLADRGRSEKRDPTDVANSERTRWEKREGQTTSPVLRTQQHGREDVADSGCTRVHERWQSNDAEGEDQRPGRVGTDGIPERQVIEGEALADSNNAGCQEQWRTISDGEEQLAAECRGRWLPEPNVGRVAHGIPKRVDRLRGLGNAIVPQVAYEIINALKRKENETHHCR